MAAILRRATHTRRRKTRKTRTGRRSMSPLGSSLVCSPAENLQVSRVRLHSARRGVRRRRPFWYFGMWNVRSLLDSEGSVETARQGLDCHQVTEDRRIDLVVRELNRYKIPVAALQETKWFGQAMYCVGKSVVITAGRPTPQPGQSKQREGVAVVLSGLAITTWKKGPLCYRKEKFRSLTCAFMLCTNICSKQRCKGSLF